MTGSAKIRSGGVSINQGFAIYLDANGFAGLATADFFAFAVATDGAPPGGIVTYSTDGQVERSDWTMVTGKRLLTVGQVYYLSGTGKLATKGLQQIGIAKSRTILTIKILQAVEPTVQIHTFLGRPPASLGKVGDLVIDEVSLTMMKKGHYGWSTLGRFVSSKFAGPITMVRTIYGWGPYAT